MQPPSRARFLLALALLAGCSGKDGVVAPPPSPPLPQGVVVEDNVVRWTTDVESRGTVRYGFVSENLDHMAYPMAASRQDRALRLEHRVPLLDVRNGQRVYIQTVNEVPGRPAGYSEVGSFAATGDSPADILTSTMIHIGFGDSHLITMPNGRRVLVDGGERDAARSVAQYLDQHGVTALDAVLATHVHIDHLGGLIGEFGTPTDGILARGPAVFFDSPEKTHVLPAYDEELETAARAGVRRVVLVRGQTSVDTPELNWDPRVRVVVLSSGRLPNYTPGQERTDINNDSVVLKWSYGDVDFVIGGDAEAAAEASMLRAFPGSELEVEYYKAHHHGLPDASTASWLATLKPRVGFIPVTDLSFNGPVAGAIEWTSTKLTELGAHVYVIDEAPSLGRFRSSGVQYNVTFATDGESYEVRLEPARQTVSPKPTATCVQDDPDLQGLLGGAAHRHEVSP